jgi:outer membrane protein assembly factor BamB
MTLTVKSKHSYSSSVSRLILFLLVTLVVAPAQASDWPQWRGPTREGIADENGLLKEWPTDGPVRIWQNRNIGFGFGTPAVVGEIAFLVGNEGIENEFVRALNIKDGSVIWTTPLGKVGKPDQRPNYPGARSTPTIAGDSVYVLSSDGVLACMDREAGNVRWKRNLQTDFGGKSGNWAYAESPLVDGDQVIVTPSGSDATLVAINRESGDVNWKTLIPQNDEAGYASAIIGSFAGMKQYISFIGSGLAGIDPSTGNVLWESSTIKKNSQTTPVSHGGYIYHSAGRVGGSLVKLEQKANKITPQEIFSGTKVPKAMGGYILISNHVYGSDGQTMMCMNFKTGEIIWEERSLNGSNICYADGLFYLHGQNGDLALAEATPEGYREISLFTPTGQADRGPRGRAMTAPIVANGKLYVRDGSVLSCYAIK